MGAVFSLLYLSIPLKPTSWSCLPTPPNQTSSIALTRLTLSGLSSSISDDETSARLEIHTTSSTLTIVREFDNPEDMKEEFERLERIIKGGKAKAQTERAVGFF